MDNSHLWTRECGDGWRNLIEPLVRLCKIENVEITQVKEKFGRLRFYTAAGASDVLSDAIEAAEAASATICELCGEPGVVRGGSWLRTLCDAHANGRPEAPDTQLKITRVYD